MSHASPSQLSRSHSWLLVALLCLAAPALAQDPAVVNPGSVKVVLANDRVRVLESTLEPGQKEQLHSHPACVIHVLAGGTARNHSADGRTTEVTLETGATVYREPLTHWAENIGKTTIHLIIVELLDTPPAPPGQS